MNHGRRAAGTTAVVLALAVAVATLCGGVFSRTAQAATAYRYWAYYVASGASWQYSQRGPAAEHPADGEVQGWRFAVQADSTGSLAPRTTPDFAKLCASTAAVAGQLRVGIVLDFGTAADAPAGEKPPAGVVTGCVHVPSGASGVAVLDAAVGTGQVRIGAGLICGIDGYPKSECAPAVNVSTPTPAATPTRVATPTGVATPSPTAVTPAAASARSATSAPSAAAPPESLRPAAESATPAVRTSVPGTADPSATDSATTSNPPATTLDSLPTDSGSHGLPVTAILGGVLVVCLGAAATWRGLARHR